MNLLLRFVGTSFQVYLSGRIGASGIGLLQIVMSVGSFGMVAGMAGIRTATMYLTAEELGRKRADHIAPILSGCFLYSILCSTVAAMVLYGFAPILAEKWIGDARTVGALRLLAAFLPTTCLCGVMTGYFTAANRIGTLAAVEVAEQLCSMILTLTILRFWAGDSSARACQSVVLGSSLGGCLTLLCLIVLRLLEKSPHPSPLPVHRRICNAAIPLAFADILRTGIGTLENLMVPKRLSKNITTPDPLAAFGIVSGMVFPVLMFPASILYGLAELLIPELARCCAAGSKARSSYLLHRTLKVAMLYGCIFGGLLFLTAEDLCDALYHNSEAGKMLQWYAPLIPMLYCDALTDAMTKGLGQQRACVRYNIITNTLDVLLLFFLLPRFGMRGYFLSFLFTHLLNFILSLRRLLKITGEHIQIRIPILSAFCTLFCTFCASHLSQAGVMAAAYAILLVCSLYPVGVIRREDLIWLKGLMQPRHAH